MSRTPDSTDAAARVRAARAYRNFTQKELAEGIGVSVATMKRIEDGSRPMSTEDLIAVANACGIPTGFMLRGMEAFAIEPDLSLIAEKIREMEAEMHRRLSDLEERQDTTEDRFREG